MTTYVDLCDIIELERLQLGHAGMQIVWHEIWIFEFFYRARLWCIDSPCKNWGGIARSAFASFIRLKLSGVAEMASQMAERSPEGF